MYMYIYINIHVVLALCHRVEEPAAPREAVRAAAVERRHQHLLRMGCERMETKHNI